MEQKNVTSLKNKLLLGLKWIFSVLFFFLALVATLGGKAFICGITFLLIAVLLFPPISKLWNEKIPFLRNKLLKGCLLLILLIIGFISIGKSDTNFSSKLDNVGKKQSPYQNYIDNVEENIRTLTPEQKSIRDRLYAELKSNATYKALITDSVISIAYLPVLTAISNGISQSTSDDIFLINNIIVKEIEKADDGEDKLRFSIIVTSLASNSNGGVPTEIIDVFERYEKEYSMYGKKEMLVNMRGNRTTIETDYDLTPFFGMIDPKNKDILNKIYEAKREKVSEWTNTEKAIYPYLASRKGYANYIKQVYPKSPYMLNVDYDYELSIDEIFEAYDMNEVSADEKYKGKKVAITGDISSINKDLFNKPYVSMNLNYLNSISFYLSKENNNAISKLSKGQTITIIGECRGLTLFTIVIINCRLVE